ncbi:hypothetical protein [Tunturiibacter gelidoferens]|uniref:Adhesin domain-containing protein n=1 Tax=Tunturiibacter lichenicola TaxID=2051959 RepID=A0A7Y9NNS7_9BACT|nr:hypothetical protein [Edaphobacter lichenicola]NYF52789.1 hypothetical protein [Edaphobacter lichenicola]
MPKSFLFVFAFMAATTLCARAAQNDSMDCGEFDKPITTHDYTSAPSDILQPHHLEVARSFAPDGKLKLHICRADLRLNIQPDAKEIKLTITLNTQSGSYTIANYIQTLRVLPDKGVINLNFPKAAHATVTITLPMGLNSDNEINLGYGDLNFNAAGSAGHRQFNVGMGHMNLLLDKDKSYSKLEVNVGLGTLHDHRPGGSDGHFTTTKNYSGSGAGALEINVGMGSLDIRNE